jgi:hypothetical protein
VSTPRITGDAPSQLREKLEGESSHFNVPSPTPRRVGSLHLLDIKLLFRIIMLLPISSTVLGVKPL